MARCPSVRLSVTFVHSTQTAEDIVKLLRRPGSPIILFSTLAPIPNSNGNPFSGGAKYKGWEYFVILDWNRRLFRKRYEIGPQLLWNVNRKSYVLYRIVPLSMTLIDPWLGFQGRDFQWPWRTLTQFSRSRHCWSRISQKRCILRTKCYRTLIIGNHT